MIKSTSLILLLISLVGVSQGLYFHIAETERKCFIEEIPDETTVIGKYRNCCDIREINKLTLFIRYSKLQSGTL